MLLNFAVQRILDRVIFLRIAEDRGIEPYGQLSALTAGPKIYPRLCEIFERADFRYNSGLFHFATEKGRDESPDKLTLQLALDDAALKEIIGALYYPKSPYAFVVIPGARHGFDVLGINAQRVLRSLPFFGSGSSGAAAQFDSTAANLAEQRAHVFLRETVGAK